MSLTVYGSFVQSEFLFLLAPEIGHGSFFHNLVMHIYRIIDRACALICVTNMWIAQMTIVRLKVLVVHMLYSRSDRENNSTQIILLLSDRSNDQNSMNNQETKEIATWPMVKEYIVLLKLTRDAAIDPLSLGSLESDVTVRNATRFYRSWVERKSLLCMNKD